MVYGVGTNIQCTRYIKLTFILYSLVQTRVHTKLKIHLMRKFFSPAYNNLFYQKHDQVRINNQQCKL